MWDKNKTTWAVGIGQLTHHSVRGGGKNPSTLGLGIFAPHLEPRGELIAQYRPPMSFRYRITCQMRRRLNNTTCLVFRYCQTIALCCQLFTFGLDILLERTNGPKPCSVWYTLTLKNLWCLPSFQYHKRYPWCQWSWCQNVIQRNVVGVLRSGNY